MLPFSIQNTCKSQLMKQWMLIGLGLGGIRMPLEAAFQRELPPSMPLLRNVTCYPGLLRVSPCATFCFGCHFAKLRVLINLKFVSLIIVVGF